MIARNIIVVLSVSLFGLAINAEETDVDLILTRAIMGRRNSSSNVLDHPFAPPTHETLRVEGERLIGRIRELLPNGGLLSRVQIESLYVDYIINRMPPAVCRGWGGLNSSEEVTGNAVSIGRSILTDTNSIWRLSGILQNVACSNYHRFVAETMLRTLPPCDETTRFAYSLVTNSNVHGGGSAVSDYLWNMTESYTNGCSVAMSNVVRNVAATFSEQSALERIYPEAADRLLVSSVPGYATSEMRYCMATNNLWHSGFRYFRKIKEDLEALGEENFTTPVFTGTPQR